MEHMRDAWKQLDADHLLQRAVEETEQVVFEPSPAERVG
jgi:hypothetical protein